MTTRVTLPAAGVFLLAMIAPGGAFALNAPAAPHGERQLKNSPATGDGAVNSFEADCLRAHANEWGVIRRMDDLATLNAKLTERIEALAVAETGAGASP